MNKRLPLGAGLSRLLTAFVYKTKVFTSKLLKLETVLVANSYYNSNTAQVARRSLMIFMNLAMCDLITEFYDQPNIHSIYFYQFQNGDISSKAVVTKKLKYN
jgi:hypothetical protein